MDTFRHFSRRAWLLHGYLLASLILWPVPTVRSYWTWDTGTGAKVEIENPPAGDSWWDVDSDDDGMTNAEEVVFGSDPYCRDSDYDGLTDTDERDLTGVLYSGTSTTDPWNWDSDGDGYSDHDEYWTWQSGLSPNVNYSGQTPPSPIPADYYRDIDGDGAYNLWDYAPTDSGVTSPPWDPGTGDTGSSTPPDPSTIDSDGDGVMDASDSHPTYYYLWEDWNYNGTNDSQEPPPNSDSDWDGYYDTNDSHPYNSMLWEDWNWNGTNDSQETLPTYPDPSYQDPYYTDGDGDGHYDANDSDPSNPTLWEDWNRNGTNDSFEPPDADGDGVTDDDENAAGTNPWFHDSDGDGLSDSEERTAQTNPLQVDTDGDGLTDHEEVFIYQTNPLLARSLPGQQQTDYHQVNLTDGDQDGIPDLVEAWYGRDPASAVDAASDRDLDGHTDLEAYLAGWSFTVSFTSYDQDRDGITDARESYWGFNPYDADDATEDADHDGLLNIEEIRLGLDPLSASTYGTPDLEYVNTTWNLGWQRCLSPGSPATLTDNDTDGDGMSDAWEHRHRLNLRDPSDAIRDPDKDTLSNLTEFRFQTHPRIPKTQNNVQDRTRLYATGKPLNASTAGGLMNRYRAQMAADLKGVNQPRNFTVFDKKYPTVEPDDGGGEAPPFSISNIERTYTKTTDGTKRTVPQNSRPVPGDLEAGTDPANHPCGKKDCENISCVDGYDGNCLTCQGNTRLSCPGLNGAPAGKHRLTCSIMGSCGGHSYEAHEFHAVECPIPIHQHNNETCQAPDTTQDPTCGMVLHGHEAGCDSCVLAEHNHDMCTFNEEDSSWSCGQAEHAHGGGGCLMVRTCGFSIEHVSHVGACYPNKVCDLEAHARHDDACQKMPCGFPDSCRGRQIVCPGKEACSNWSKCSECQDKGFYDVSCKGTDESPDPDCGYPAECPRCKGSGKEKCSACGGTGHSTQCECGYDCGCYGELTEPGQCPQNKADEYYTEEGEVTYNGPSGDRVPLYLIYADGEQVGIIGPNNPTMKVGPTQSDPIQITAVQLEEPQNDFRPVGVNPSDGAGARYRKIGLNGLPIPDSKPQGQDESGEHEEETYVDAFTRQLRHSVSDIYERAEGSELPLMVRRDAAPDVHSLQSGLRPLERPELAFGPCWSSNICAYIKIESTTSEDPDITRRPQHPVTASVVDEQGASQGFVYSQGQWTHNGQESRDAKSRSNTLSSFSVAGAPAVLVLRKKFGATCYYEAAGITQCISSDRTYGSWDTSNISYMRLSQVIDRFGNRLIYTYPFAGTLIPSRIEDPDRPGRFIQIHQVNGLVQSVQGPGGEVVSYTSDASGRLHTVKRGLPGGPGPSVTYGYSSHTEEPLPPDPPPSEVSNTPPLAHHHLNLSSITDELGRLYGFSYEVDQQTTHTSYSDSGPSKTVQQGMPMLVKEISSDAAGKVLLSGIKKIETHSPPPAGKQLVNMDLVRCQVTAVDQSVTTYQFSESDYFYHSPVSNPLQMTLSVSCVCTATKMVISRSSSGSTVANPYAQETYAFDPAASMALSYAIDRSNKRTKFTYGDAVQGGGASQFTMIYGGTILNGTTVSHYDDPTTETSYLIEPGSTTETPVAKHFTYDPDTRIMTSMTDPMGVRTVYSIDNSRTISRDGMTIPIRGLKTAEKVFDAQNNLLRETRYSYNHPTFSGLVTKQWTISPDEDVMPSSVTTTTLGVPGSAGFSGGWCEDASRAWILADQDSTSPAYRCGWWREVTTTTGPATAGGELDSGSSPSALSSSLSLSDLGGRKRQVIDARGFATLFGYDASGRLARVYQPDGSAKALGYDAHGNLISESEGTFTGGTLANAIFTPLRTTFHAYDASNRRIKSAVDLNGNGQPDWDTTPTADYGPDDHSYTPAGSTPGTATSPPVYDGDIVTTTRYNNIGQVHEQTDPRGNHTINTYDEQGRLINVWNEGHNTLFYYDGYNNGGSIFDSSAIKPNRTVDPRGVVTTVVYDSLYRPISSTVTDPGLHDREPFTVVTLTEYDLNGKPIKLTKPTSLTDPLVRVTLNEYDALGNLTKVTEPDLTTVQSFYTHHGKPWKVIDQMGNETITTYDALGRAVQVKAPPVNGQGGQVQAITTTEYDAAGNVIAVTDPLDRVVETVYDERNRPTHVYAPTMWDAVSGQFVRPYAVTTYDALGQPLSVTDHTGATTTNHYDPAGRKWKVEAPAILDSSPSALSSTLVRPTTLTSFDPGGLPLTVTNPLGQTITNTYDIHGRLKTTLDAEGILNEFDYDAAGNRTLVKDGLNQQTTFAYDGLNRLIEQTFANGDTWTHTYNACWKTSQTSPRGITTSYTYDARDRLLTVTATPAPVAGSPPSALSPLLQRSYTYDNAGKLLTVSELDPNSSPSALSPSRSVSYTYDAMGRVTAESSRGQVHHYEYDLAGNRVKATYSTGRVVETSYDGLNRPEAIVDGDRLTRYGYDKAGRAVILVAANGQTSSNTYDALGRLTDRVLYKSPAMDPAQRLAQFKWQHDLLGNVTKQEEIWPGEATRAAGVRSTTMGYDDNNRLISETISHPVDGTITTAYTYDDANNRTTKTVTGGAEPGYWDYDYNAANQLTSWEKHSEAGSTSQSLQKSATLTYDDAGNRTSQNVTTWNSEPETSNTQYTWDAQDRLASVTLPNGSVHRYEYDYRTRRVGTSESPSASGSATKSTAIVFSGGLSVAEWESSSSFGSTSGAPTVEYTRGPDMGGGVGGLLYTSRSESASRTLRYNLSNGRGDIVAQSDQYASLTWTASYEAYGKRTKETGENKDKQRGNSKDEDPTGLLNEGFRYRDIETGVWLSRDPAGFVDGPNLYAYVKQNPWTAWDPDGLAMVDDMNAWAAQKVADDSCMAGPATALVAGTHAVFELFSLGAWGKNNQLSRQEEYGIISREQMVTESVVNSAESAVAAAILLSRLEAVIEVASNPELPDVEPPGDGPESTPRDLTDEERETYRRAPLRKGVKEEIWEQSKSGDGQVYDPSTGRPISEDEPWDAGHKPEYKREDAARDAAERKITRKEWIDEQNNPNLYRAERPIPNQEHTAEGPPGQFTPGMPSKTAPNVPDHEPFKRKTPPPK